MNYLKKQDGCHTHFSQLTLSLLAYEFWMFVREHLFFKKWKSDSSMNLNLRHNLLLTLTGFDPVTLFSFTGSCDSHLLNLPLRNKYVFWWRTIFCDRKALYPPLMRSLSLLEESSASWRKAGWKGVIKSNHVSLKCTFCTTQSTVVLTNKWPYSPLDICL